MNDQTPAGETGQVIDMQARRAAIESKASVPDLPYLKTLIRDYATRAKENLDKIDNESEAKKLTQVVRKLSATEKLMAQADQLYFQAQKMSYIQKQLNKPK